ncbi:MAG: ABC transporter permease [Acidobacteria bacterium]|nr:ABC transporter permease [Acidobacteriota bacterium]
MIIDLLARDVRVGARMLVKAPIFTIFTVLVLAIGIGANVVVFTYLNAAFLKPLDVPDPGRLVRISMDAVGINARISTEAYSRVRESNQSFLEIGHYYLRVGPAAPIRIEGPRSLPVDIVQTAAISGGLFKVIGVNPVLGRGIDYDDERPGSPDVVMLSEQAWKQYFASDPSVVGRWLFLNNTPHTIIGVVPRAFHAALEVTVLPTRSHLFVPVKDFKGPGTVLGRLQPGVSRTAAQADLSRIVTQVSSEAKFRISLSLEAANRPPMRRWVEAAFAIAVFMIAVLVVLLIACDNIAILLVARIAASQREMGVRLALGAGRGQLVRQLLAENLMLSVLGGIGATIFVLLTARTLERISFQLPLGSSLRTTFDWRVLLFTTGISLATTLFFGLRPALQCVKKDIAASLTPGGRPEVLSLSSIRSNLVITQVTLCTALLVTAATPALSVPRMV